MSEFNREERYIVIKRKNLNEEDESDIRRLLADFNSPTVECVVVESDWPNYRHVWDTVKRVHEGKWPPKDNEVRLIDMLTRCLGFVEMNSNRYDGFSTDHPQTLVEQARALLGELDAGEGGE